MKQEDRKLAQTDLWYESLQYLGLRPRATRLASIAYSRHRFYSDSVWDEVITSLCGIDDKPDEIIQSITSRNQYLAVKCIKSGINISLETQQLVANLIKDALISSGNDYHYALELLANWGSDIATNIIIGFLEYPKTKDDHDRREQAVKMLGRTKNPIAIPALLNALHDEDGEVTWFTALSLAKMPNPPIREILDLFINSELNSDLDWRTAEALTRIGSPIIPYLTPLIVNNQTSIQLQRRLAQMLVRVSPTVEAIPGFLQIMKDTDEDYRNIRQDAVDRLEELKAVDPLASLLPTLNDSGMKQRVIGRLKRIGTPEAVAIAKQWTK